MSKSLSSSHSTNSSCQHAKPLRHTIHNKTMYDQNVRKCVGNIQMYSTDSLRRPTLFVDWDNI